MELDEAIKKRHSVRKFTSKKPDWRKIIEAIDYARQAPSAGNIQTLKIIIVNNNHLIKKIAKASQQDFIADAQYLAVFCTDLGQAEKMYGDKMNKYSKQQAGAAMQNFMLKLTDLGMATCWVGAFADDEIKEILKIPSHIDIETIFPIGFELGHQKSKPHRELVGMVYFNSWNAKRMETWPRTEV